MDHMVKMKNAEFLIGAVLPTSADPIHITTRSTKKDAEMNQTHGAGVRDRAEGHKDREEVPHHM